MQCEAPDIMESFAKKRKKERERLECVLGNHSRIISIQCNTIFKKDLKTTFPHYAGTMP